MTLRLGQTYDIAAADGAWSDSVALDALKSLLLINRGTFPVELRTTAEGSAELKLSPNGAAGSVLIVNYDSANTAPTIISARGVGGASTARVIALPVSATVGAVGPSSGGGASLSNAAAAALAAAAAAGVSETAARADHVHAFPAVANVDLARVVDLGTPAEASGNYVHNLYADNINVNWPGAFTNPDVPRTLQVDFQNNWGGGDVTVNGLDQYGDPVSEVFAVAIGAVNGSKVFASVTGATNAQLGGGLDSASIGIGDRLGLDIVGGDVVALTNTGGRIWGGGLSAPAVVDTVNGSIYDPDLFARPDGINAMTAVLNVTHRHTLG